MRWPDRSLVTLPMVLALVLAACSGEDGEGEDGGVADGAEDGSGGGDGEGADAGADDGDGDGEDDSEDDDDDTGADDDTADAADDADDATDAGDDDTSPIPEEPPPTDADALQAWLAAGSYLEWPAESGVHASTGPHFGGVRTFVNQALLASLQDGSDPHPVDAASVKELFGDGAEVRGWSVLVKVDGGSGGNTWYFYEVYDGTVFGDGVGDGSCTGCHGAGAIDYFKSPFPLQ